MKMPRDVNNDGNLFGGRAPVLMALRAIRHVSLHGVTPLPDRNGVIHHSANDGQHEM